jgi:hypothetical protein
MAMEARFMAIETMIKWLYENQIKLLEKMAEIGEKAENMKRGLDEFSDSVNRWMEGPRTCTHCYELLDTDVSDDGSDLDEVETLV